MPVIKPIQINNTRIEQHGPFTFSLSYNNVQYMFEDISRNISLKEFQSHIDIAKGHVICTGLGFLLREEKLLKKKRVDSVTVIEINKDVIEIQRKLNPKIMDKLIIINADANTYKGECDTLLLDHFESESNEEIDKMVKQCCKNIRHNRMKYWAPTKRK